MSNSDHPADTDSLLPAAPRTQPETGVIALTDHRVIAVRGADARSFLQGQLSQDVLTLAPRETRRASLNNPQGRCLVILYILADYARLNENETDVLCVTPESQAATLVNTLRRYVLRSKVTLADETERYALHGCWTSPSGSASVTTVHWPHTLDGRWMRLAPRRTSAPDTGDAYALAAWHAADITAGLPRLTPRTEGEFVAQMLNLDALDAISFKKGCYTGQEVIARAHFRGRVKRRLQRFCLALPPGVVAPTPGESIQLSDGRSATVVDIMRDPNNDTSPCECLAVTTFDAPKVPEARPMSYRLPD